MNHRHHCRVCGRTLAASSSKELARLVYEHEHAECRIQMDYRTPSLPLPRG